MVEALWVDCDNRAKVGRVVLVGMKVVLVEVFVGLSVEGMVVLTLIQAIGDLASSVRSQYIGQMAEQFQVGGEPGHGGGDPGPAQAALFVYDEGLLGNDVQLAGALWRRFFISMAEVVVLPLPSVSQDEEEQPLDAEKVEMLVSYVRRTATYLAEQDAATIIVRNNIAWPKLVQ